MELLLFLLVIPLLFLILFRKRRKNGVILPPPPGPSGLPFIGNLHQLDTSALHHHLWLLSKKYGPLMSLKLGFVPTLVVSSAKIAKEVLKTNDLEFSGRPNFLSQQKLSYNGFDLTFAPYGEYWREMRKICFLHLFGPNRVQSFSSIREEEVSRMIKTISGSASDSELAITNLSELLLSLTSSIICRIAFGKRYGTVMTLEVVEEASTIVYSMKFKQWPEVSPFQTISLTWVVGLINSLGTVVGLTKLARNWICSCKRSLMNTLMREGPRMIKRIISLISYFSYRLTVHSQ